MPAGNEIISSPDIRNAYSPGQCVVQSSGATWYLWWSWLSSCVNTRKCHSVPAVCQSSESHWDTVNMEQARDQVDQVTNIMRGNVDKIMERDGKLQDLENKAEQLQADSQQFQVWRWWW